MLLTFLLEWTSLERLYCPRYLQVDRNIISLHFIMYTQKIPTDTGVFVCNTVLLIVTSKSRPRITYYVSAVAGTLSYRPRLLIDR